MSIFSTIKELQESGIALALCTVVKVSGSTPRKIGAKMLVFANGDQYGEIIGSIGGGAIEHHIRLLALKALSKQQAQLVNTSLRNELAMCCGGEMSIFIDPILPKPELFCFGAGHIIQALAPLALGLDFKLHIIDSRTELLKLAVFAGAQTYHDQDFFLSSWLGSQASYLLIATHDHQLDQHIIESLINYPSQYLALVGSKRKALMTKKRLGVKGMSENIIAKLICPAGLDINAHSPAEIALSIAAQLTKVRNEPSSLDRSCRPQLTHGHSESLISD